MRVFSIKGPENWGESLEGSLVTNAPLPLPLPPTSIPDTGSYSNPLLIKPHLRIQSLLGLNQNLRSSLAGDTILLEDVIEVVSITSIYISEVKKNLFIILKN